MAADGTERRQSAYQILVASSATLLTDTGADVWNSGKILSDQSQWVQYRGRQLDRGGQYFWSVRIWDEKGRPSAFSKPGRFFVSEDSDGIKAEWISDSTESRNVPGNSAAPMFRKNFTLAEMPAKAILRYTGAGYIDMYANGSHCSEAVLQPSFTRYDKRMEYATEDITSLLRKGENVLACMAGNGFYNVGTRSAWKFDKAPWKGRPAVMCNLELTMKDGSRQVIITDESWKTAPGPVIFNQIRNGESYDARKEQDGWASYGFNDSSWHQAIDVKGPAGKLSPAIIPPMHKMSYLKAVSITEPAPGIYLFDFGQNLTGWTQLTLKGREGDEIVVKHGERIDSAGRLDQKELSRFIFTGETQTSRYICKGLGKETWEPRFTYYGFRYAEVTGLKEKPGEETLKACIVHTDFSATGELYTGNNILNKIHENTLWSYLGNFHSIPEDCPHREKMGWTGDGQLAAGTGMLNFFTYNGYRKWLNDFTDEQKPDGNLPGIIPTSGWGYDYGRDPVTRPYGYGPQWDGACITIPWKLYLNYGDTTVLSDYYPMMEKYMNLLGSIAKDNLLDIGIDDHKSLVESDPAVGSSAYYYLLSSTMANIAGVTGMPAEAQKYSDLSGKIARSFINKYFVHTTTDSISFLTIALAVGFDMLPAGMDSTFMKEMVRRIRMNDYHVYTGVIGTNAAFSALVKKGYPEVFLRVITNPEYPSYGYWIREGATTMWQNWDGSQSRNHIMFGFVDEYMYDVLLGLKNEGHSAGYREFVLQPFFAEGINEVNTSHLTMYGRIISSWVRKGDIVIWNVTVPVNTQATLCFPQNAKDIQPNETLSNNLSAAGEDVGYTIRLGSGNYRFSFSYEK